MFTRSAFMYHLFIIYYSIITNRGNFLMTDSKSAPLKIPTSELYPGTHASRIRLEHCKEAAFGTAGDSTMFGTGPQPICSASGLLFINQVQLN